jgi:predicted Zn-dependent protease
MKLRRYFAAQQLLSLLFIALSATAIAQTQEKIVMRDGRSQDVKITGVTPSGVQVQIGAGSVTVPMANIAQVVMAPPPEFNAAVAAYEARDYAKALASTKVVVEKFKGLPANWAQQATGMVGDIYLALNDPARAEAAYQDFQKIYPGRGSLQTEVGLARLAIQRKDFATAKQKLTPIATAALKQREAPLGAGSAYSQTFYLLGQIEESEKNYPAALQDYLRTVTLFYDDRSSLLAAQEKADALRKEHGAVVP